MIGTSDLCFWNRRTQCRVVIPRLPFSLIMGSDALFGVTYTEEGDQIYHYTTKAPQLCARASTPMER